MKKQAELLHEGSDYLISLSKLTDKKVIDAIGYISENFGFPVFKVTELVFDDNTTIGLEGEHDIAFIPQDSDSRMPPNMDEKNLQALADE